MRIEGDSPDYHTDFTGYSHEQLLQMFGGATPNHAFEAFMRLGAASQALTEAAKVLSTEMGHLDWEGPAADRFRAWADQIVASTHKLSDYSTTVGKRMADVAITIGSVKLPPVPSGDVDLVNSAATNPAAVSFVVVANPAEAVTLSADIDRAKANIENQRQEAASEMRKLAMGYESAGRQLSALTPPVFPPPLNLWNVGNKDLDPGDPIPVPDAADGDPETLSATGTSTPPVGTVASGPQSAAAPSGPPTAAPVAAAAPAAWPPGQDAAAPPVSAPYVPQPGVDLAGAGTLTAPQTNPSALGGPAVGPPGPPAAPVVGSGGPAGPGSVFIAPPVVGPPRGGTGTTGGTGGPGRTGKVPGVSGGTTSATSATSKYPGTPASPTGAHPIPGRPPISGGTGAVGGRTGAGGTTGGANGPRAYGRPTGIVGGQSVERPTGGSPRGGPRTGAVQGGTPRPGTPAAAPERTATGVGNRPFSQGGSGLRPGVAQDERRERGRARRAESLDEDETTWTARERAVPPVVD